MKKVSDTDFYGLSKITSQNICSRLQTV